jgi:hypothetical protein
LIPPVKTPRPQTKIGKIKTTTVAGGAAETTTTGEENLVATISVVVLGRALLRHNANSANNHIKCRRVLLNTKLYEVHCNN